MSTTAILTLGVVFCVVAVIIAVARRDAPTAAAGILGALVLGILAILSRERDRYNS